MNHLFVKGLIALFLLSIFFSLLSALYFLLVDKGKSTRSVKALTWRISLSLLLFGLLLVAYSLGWIKPHEFWQ